jgi:hypothetical protein
VNERLACARVLRSSGAGANRAQRRAQGQLNPVMRLQIVRAAPARQSTGRRSQKRHHIACLCCDDPTRAQRTTTTEGVA